MFFPSKMVIFHSYVTLPEGMDVRPPKKMRELQDLEGRKKPKLVGGWVAHHRNLKHRSYSWTPKSEKQGGFIIAQSPKISASSGDGIGPGGYMPLIPLHRNLVAGKSVDSADLRVLFRVHGVMMRYMDCGCWWSCCCAVIALCGSPPDIAITCTDRCFALDLLPKKTTVWLSSVESLIFCDIFKKHHQWLNHHSLGVLMF